MSSVVPNADTEAPEPVDVSSQDGAEAVVIAAATGFGPHKWADRSAQAALEDSHPGRAVILADSDRSVCIWYYADRPIIFNVWDPKTLEADLKLPQQAELPVLLRATINKLARQTPRSRYSAILT